MKTIDNDARRSIPSRRAGAGETFVAASPAGKAVVFVSADIEVDHE
jgi:hypothetical protein